MTEKDKQLIEQADKLSRYNYFIVDDFIEEADTEEAVKQLLDIRCQLYDLMLETL